MTNPALKTAALRLPPAKPLKKIHALQKRGKFRESRPLCDKLASQGYESPDLLHFHGLALRACDDLEGALVKIFAATEIKPDDALMLNSLGVILLQMKEFEPAIEVFKRATKADEKLYEAWKNLGLALRKVDRCQAAQVAFMCAHHLDRSRTEPLLNIVYLLIDNRQYKHAEDVMDKLLAKPANVTPSLLVQRLNIAARLEDFDYIVANREAIDRTALNVNEKAELDHIWAYYLQIHDKYDEAIAILEEWVDVKSMHQDHFATQLGLCYAAAGRLDDGLAFHRALLERNPEHVAGRYNLALLQMHTGEVAEGFANYETRWRRREFPSIHRKFDAPRWQGEPLEGKELLVWREQGIGDEVRFASLMPELEPLGATVIFECSTKLAPLWERSFPWATIRHEGDAECRGDPAYRSVDYQVPAGSVPRFFRNSVADFHDRQAPWIRRYGAAEERVRQQLAVNPDETLVGLCWRSSNQVTSRDRYFLRPAQLAPLGTLPACRWLNIQYDCGQQEVDEIRDLGLPLHHYANLNQKDDLVGACGLIGACDIVISVGVSVADLAAGLGVPVIQIGRERAEIFLGTDHVPWFPTCLSMRMKPYDGDRVIADIVERWPAMLEWAARVTNAERTKPANGGKALAPLDVLFEADDMSV